MPQVLVVQGDFEWDLNKEQVNIKSHGLDFESSKFVFADSQRLIFKDEKHSTEEPRYFCIGNVKGEVLTVRFTLRGKRIRIIGAGRWRRGVKLYEKEKSKKTR